MSKIYPLEWLDSLILQTLNPKRTNLKTLSERDLSLISENVIGEFQKIQVQIKNEILSIRKPRQIRLQVGRYHSTLMFLLDQSLEYQNKDMFSVPHISCIIQTIISNLEELLFFVECRFSNYLSLDCKISAVYIMVMQNEWQLKLQNLKKKICPNDLDKKTMEILFDFFTNLVEVNQQSPMTYREIRYHREILINLDVFPFSQEGPMVFTSLDQLLIGLNFNCQNYIKCLIERIGLDLNAQDSASSKMKSLLFHYKVFNQLGSNEKVVFDTSQPNIKYVLDNWFKYEIAYWEREIDLATISEFDAIHRNNIVEFSNKIECVLSIDQLALILRASNESRILKARSLRQVFKTIVPHLSTGQKKELSHDSMRSKSYRPEDRDKEIAIITLEQLIRHIKEF